MPRVVQALNSETSAGCNQARKAMQVLHQSDKKIEFTDGLMVSGAGGEGGVGRMWSGGWIWALK